MDSIGSAALSRKADGKGISPGLYLLSPIVDGAAIMDSITVEIRSISDK